MCSSDLAAAGAQIASDPESVIPMVGASGAISGVLGAYIVLHPRTKVLVMILGRMTARISAFWVLGLWIGLQLVSALAEPAEGVEGAVERSRVERHRDGIGERGAFGVVGIRGETEAHLGLIDLVGLHQELREARGAVQHQGQHACRQRVQRPQMPNSLRGGDTPHFSDYVVRRPATWLVDDNDSVHLLSDYQPQPVN